VCCVLFGCASLPRPDEMKAEIAMYQLPKFPDDGKAIVYVVRPSSFGAKEAGFNVFLDSKEPHSEMGSTMGRQYIHFPLAPGEHTIWSHAGNWAEIRVSAKPGDMVFIQQEPSMGLIDLNNELLRLPEYEGKYYVKTLTPGTLISRNQPTGPTGPIQASVEHAANPPKGGARSPSTVSEDGVRLPFTTVTVRPFTRADGVGVSQDFLTYFSGGLRDELVKAGVARQVVNEGGVGTGVDAGETIVLEGKIIGYTTAWYGIIVTSEINVYRRSDNALLKTMTPEAGAKASPFNTDKNVGENTGKKTAYEIKKAMN
jgi:hypothetical protein